VAAGNSSTAALVPSDHSAVAQAKEHIQKFLANMSLTDLVLQLLGRAAHIAEDLMYIVLFLIFLLHHASEHTDMVGDQVEKQIFNYIRGKATISAYVGVSHGLVLWAVGLQGLCLSFAVLTFLLNFIPTVGGMGAVLLPMPLIALDEEFGGGQNVVAFIAPLCNNIFAKDVLEPKILGEATNLSPVAVMLSILLFGAVWGIVGMVLAIPLTAVLRIYLESLHHPVPKMIARRMSGGRSAV